MDVSDVKQALKQGDSMGEVVVAVPNSWIRRMAALLEEEDDNMATMLSLESAEQDEETVTGIRLVGRE